MEGSLACGCRSLEAPPFVRFCARHDPARVEALERVCREMVLRVKQVRDGTDSSTGRAFFPRFTAASTSDRLDDLVEELVALYRSIQLPDRPLAGETAPGGPG